ncbi:hypothetical protein Tco_1194008 [Tanacetum coccineum]
MISLALTSTLLGDITMMLAFGHCLTVSFPITLTGATKRWVDIIPLGIVDSWDFLKKAFIQRTHALTTPKSGIDGHPAERIKVVVLKGSLCADAKTVEQSSSLAQGLPSQGANS